MAHLGHVAVLMENDTSCSWSGGVLVSIYMEIDSIFGGCVTP